MQPLSLATENLKNAIVLATKAAGEVVYTDFVGSEHLVYAFLQIPACEAYHVLTENGVTLADYEREFFSIVKGLKGASGLTANTQKMYDRGAEEAQRDGLPVTTAHILYEVLCTPSCYAGRILRRLAGDGAAEQKTLIERLARRTEEAIKVLAYKKNKGEDVAALTGGQASDASISKRFEELRAAEEAEAKGKVKLAGEEKVKSRGARHAAKLPDCGVDMTERARRGKMDPVIGRKKEIEKAVQVLSRRMKNNPVLIGEPGVGKSAIVEGLAQLIAKNEVPEQLLNKTIFSVDLPGMLAGTRYRGDFEEKLKNLIDVVTEDGDILLFIDEIHSLVGAGGSTDNNMDAANILKPLLARGDLQLIGATTIEEYRKYIEKDGALERRFTPVYVEEPKEADAIAILKGLRAKYEKHHGIVITDEAVEAAVKLSTRYITDRFLPDKAIDLIDEAAAQVRIAQEGGSVDLQEAKREFERLERERKEYEDRKEYALASEAFASAQRALEKYKALRQAQAPLQLADGRSAIGKEHVAAIVSARMRIPLVKITQEEGEKLMRLEQDLHARIIGQNQAVTAVSKAIRRARAGLKDPSRPIGSFIFVGPTGVGKTDLCKALAEALFGNEEQMIRLDMSEYMEKQAISKIIGAPPGYVGFEDLQSGQLTERVRTNPYSVILFDEIEKAHPDVFNLLLQILDDGRLTDSRGRTVSFKNAVIILTSNVGAGGGENEDYEQLRARTNEALKAHFRPEFLNRMDEIIVFHPLSKEDCVKIGSKMIRSLAKRLLEQRGIILSVTEGALRLLVEEGYDAQYGARPLRRVIQSKIEDRLSDEILLGKIENGQTITIDVRGGELIFI